MSVPVIVTGDDVALPVTLKKNGATFDASGATISAALVSENHATKLTSDVAQSAAASGADWANSLVVVEVSSTETAAVTTYGRAILEIQVTQSAKKTTWFVTVEIIKGHVA